MDKLENIIWQSKFERKRNWLKAVKILEAGIPEFGGEASLYEEMAEIYASKKLNKKAIELYQKALEHKPDDPNITFRLGNCYLSISELKIAMYHYNRIAEPFPEAQYNKAITLARLGDSETCVGLLEEILATQPESELPYFFLVEQYLASKEYGKAIDRLMAIEATFGKRGRIYFLRGVSYTYQKNWLKAYMEFQQAEKMNFKSVNFYRAYGIASERIGKSGQAIEYLLKSIRLEPFNISAYLDLINLYIAHERLVEAHQIVEHARRIGPFTSALSLIHSKILHLIKAKYGNDDVLKEMRDIDPRHLPPLDKS
ncbi:MAG: tetratricopeptide repeat protein [Candidatus Cloacimonetes bacterium]|nr:tetratricopeptide repeat protein [Candidatus Cloacimonadota bacterium]